MKQLHAVSIGAVLMLAAAVSIAGQATKIDFETDATGAPPKGFSFALTGQGKPGAWVVKKDDAAHGNVLAQSGGDTTDASCPVGVYNDCSGTDVALSVAFKAIAIAFDALTITGR